jgi:phosphatidate cytidylyltransferase
MTEGNRNLALRVVSALVLFPTLMVVSWTGGFPFALLCAVAAAIAAHELIGMFARVGKAEAFAIAFAGVLPLAPWWAHARLGGAYPEWMIVVVGIAATVLLATALFRPGGLEHAPARASSAALAWFYCGFLCATVVAVRLRFGFGWVVMSFVVTWMNDTFAYFAGRFLGRNKMFPRISPKKTWEGFAGGFAGSIAGALVLLGTFPDGWLPGLTVAGCFALGAVGAVVGPVGDLAESMLKRAAGVKDSGTLIPGHGGLLDRIDALLFVAPWVYLFALLAA